MDIKDTLSSINIADNLDEDQLIKIGNQVADGYDTDLRCLKFNFVERAADNSGFVQATRTAYHFHPTKFY